MNAAPDTVYLTETVRSEMAAHAVEAYPRECCGILLGKREGSVWRASVAVATANLADAKIRDRYQMDPHDRFRAETRARQEGLEIVGFYHSHPDHDVYFSRTDLENSEEFLMGEPWLDPTYAYVVISVRNGQPVGQGAFRVHNGEAEPITIGE